MCTHPRRFAQDRRHAVLLLASPGDLVKRFWLRHQDAISVVTLGAFLQEHGAAAMCAHGYQGWEKNTEVI